MRVLYTLPRSSVSPQSPHLGYLCHPRWEATQSTCLGLESLLFFLHGGGRRFLLAAKSWATITVTVYSQWMPFTEYLPNLELRPSASWASLTSLSSILASSFCGPDCLHLWLSCNPRGEAKLHKLPSWETSDLFKNLPYSTSSDIQRVQNTGRQLQ